jgi:hypothetical protein
MMVALAAAIAHRKQTVATAALFESIDQRGHDACTAGAKRVADRDGAAVDVGLGSVTSASGQFGDFLVFGRHKSNDDRTARQR